MQKTTALPHLPPWKQRVESHQQVEEIKHPLAPKDLQALRQGRVKPYLELDCHGMIEHQALMALETLLQRAHKQQKRWIKIIHGKGLHSQERYPVIKNLVVNWAHLHPAIQAYTSAKSTDGGAGVLWLALFQGDRTSSD